MAIKLVWVMVIVSLVILMINNSNSEEIPKSKSSKLSKKNPKKEDIQQTMSGFLRLMIISLITRQTRTIK